MKLTELFAWSRGMNAKALAAPLLIIMMLAMMVLPLPAFALDILFSFNIALSIIVLLSSLYTVKPLDFMEFPTVLLVSTMLRLSLNVASTRVVLTEGHTGPDAAGKVIEAFGHFLIGGNYTVGIVVFVRFVWAGWLYFAAAGNAGSASNAKDMMTNAIVGAVILFASYLNCC